MCGVGAIIDDDLPTCQRDGLVTQEEVRHVSLLDVVGMGKEADCPGDVTVIQVRRAIVTFGAIFVQANLTVHRWILPVPAAAIQCRPPMASASPVVNDWQRMLDLIYGK